MSLLSLPIAGGFVLHKIVYCVSDGRLVVPPVRVKHVLGTVYATFSCYVSDVKGLKETNKGSMRKSTSSVPPENLKWTEICVTRALCKVIEKFQNYTTKYYFVTIAFTRTYLARVLCCMLQPSDNPLYVINGQFCTPKSGNPLTSTVRNHVKPLHLKFGFNTPPAPSL